MANITPVAAFRASLDKADGVQCTLTQWVCKTKDGDHPVITVPSTPPNHHTVDTAAATADPDTIDAVATTTDASTKTPPGCQSFPMGFEEP